MAFLAYRATPIAATGCSPSQFLVGRHLRTTILVKVSYLTLEWPDLKIEEAKDHKAKESYRYFFMVLDSYCRYTLGTQCD